MKSRIMKFTVNLAVSLFLATPIVAMAATPAAPVMSMTASITKMFEGTNRSAGKSLVVDGSSYYSAYTFNSTGAGNDVIKVVQSRDGGLTWEGSRDVARVQSGALAGGVGIAVSGDAVFPTKKVVHVVWEQNDGIADGIYYSSADASDLSVWSTPMKINGSTLTRFLPETVSVLTAPTGAIHVVFLGADNRLYYTSSTRYDSFFNEPIALPFTAWNDANGWYPIPATAIDNTGKLHIAAAYSTIVNSAGYQYTKQTTSGWTTPVTAIAQTTPYDNASITTFDANNIYIARNSGSTTVDFFKSSNGGTTWSKKTIATATAGDAFSGRLSIVVDKNKVLTVAASYYTAAGTDNTKMYRSTDGTAWSAATTFNNGLTRPNLTVDANGKVGMEIRTFVGDNAPQYFSKEK
jgi:hypothetical protein